MAENKSEDLYIDAIMTGPKQRIAWRGCNSDETDFESFERAIPQIGTFCAGISAGWSCLASGTFPTKMNCVLTSTSSQKKFRYVNFNLQMAIYHGCWYCTYRAMDSFSVVIIPAIHIVHLQYNWSIYYVNILFVFISAVNLFHSPKFPSSPSNPTKSSMPNP